ncbi:hypothetical protein TSTA_021290 [Talaromyces stipitatus ATCC 10500]|uniref:Uncharacterized protein n=1 Tax=Talaromyces stipitatus (strain ATCC 10500 / CBS 375.48 / QM 6759 / NRRL 1006) TaxID=441959 RepID=B8MH89_TALSN|nr:uncharacterized protein TSTA_021290 [Talaromyces stipitatus ATCC 10500]EED17068.1 hypothetical protein TSTA_021290 [Talaromyces stipitatus ATCC 10500]
MVGNSRDHRHTGRRRYRIGPSVIVARTSTSHATDLRYPSSEIFCAPTQHQWGQIDGNTDMPDPDVMFTHLGQGEKRIQIALNESIKSIQPFTLKIKNVSWWYLHRPCQAFTNTFIANDRILTHTICLGRGLEWLRADAARKYFRPTTIPKEYKRASTHGRKLFEETSQFNLGLETQYGENIINKRPSIDMIPAGSRASDVLLYQAGSHIPNRPFQLSMNAQRCNLATIGYAYYDSGGRAYLTYRISPETGA